MSTRDGCERAVSIIAGMAIIMAFAMPAVIYGASVGGSSGAGIFVIGAVIGACGVALIAHAFRP